MSFRCPVCSQELKKERKIWVCPQGHTFDIAAKGYVNLLMSNSSGAKRHGDDRLMINARRDFLSKGFYEPLREALYEALSAEFPLGVSNHFIGKPITVSVRSGSLLIGLLDK